MNHRKLVSLVALFLALATVSKAQQTTNTAILQQSAKQIASREKLAFSRLLIMARQKGWPLTITGRNGHRSYLSAVDARGYPLYVGVNDNIISAATIKTNLLWPGGSTGLNLSGSSNGLKAKIAIWDEGIVLPTHQELIGRVVQKDIPSGLSDHSTHVAGTLIATGVNPVAKGMSFQAQQLNAYDFYNDESEMMAASSNLLISNHSYGSISGWNFNTDVTPNRWEFWGNSGDTIDYKFGYYDTESQVWDSIAYNAPDYLIVKSAGNNRDENGPAVGQPYWRFNSSNVMASAGNRPAGISNNDGYDIIPTYGIAKNILTIGAVYPIPGGYTQPSDVVIAEFSSWGPSSDGRIKPDLVADGINVLSCISTANDAYAVFSGTSMASPASAGSSFLLQDYYSRLHGGSFMRSATLKGLLIHTADEAGPAPGPDYQYGWGLINMQRAASVITSANTDQLIYENNLISGNSYSLPVIASGKGPLVATICWTDPPGAVDAVNILNNPTPKLVNDLDLRVTGISNTYFPYVLNRLNPSAPATTGDNTLDNVEKIVVDSVIPGQTYTLKVTHKANLARGQQAYSLLVSGVGGQAYCASGPGSSAGTKIDSVSISNIQNGNGSASACTTYSNYTNLTVQIQSSQSIPFSIQLGSCDGTIANKMVKIFIDYNNNGTFTDGGETVAQSGVINGSGVFSGTITTPSGLKVGDYTLMRIVAVETNNPDSVLPCGTYGKGETQDYRVLIVGPANDVGVTAIVDPLGSACQSDSQRITIRVHNFGSNQQLNVPISATIQNGGTLIGTINILLPDTLFPLADAVYSFQAPFQTVVAATYTITARTSLPGDQDTANDQTASAVLITAGADSVTGSAEICSNAPPTASLVANVSDSNNLAIWYDSPTSTTPIIGGNRATTTVIPANKTYYLAMNDVGNSKIGPPNKMVFPNGGYNAFQGNYVTFTCGAPVTIESARLYITHGGTITFTIAQIVDTIRSSNAYSYYPISSSTLTVYPTTPNPQPGAVTGNNAQDTGAVYYLNLPVPAAGSYGIIIDCEDGASIFRNNGITVNPYPVGIPGVFTITGNSAKNTTDTLDVTFYQQYYYFFYNLAIQLTECASPRVPVVASTGQAAVITLVSNVLTSNSAKGNQWYLNDSLLAGQTGQLDTPSIAGAYFDIISDSAGCASTSNTIDFGTAGGGISMRVEPNPNNGIFKLVFEVSAASDVSVNLINTLGQRVYSSSYPGFVGIFDQQLALRSLSPGMYVVQVLVGGSSYTKKILIN